MEKEVRTKFTTLYIDPIVSKRLAYYTQAASGEVSGLGTITRDDKGRHVVNKVFLLDQESSAADTELKPEAISKLMTDMMKNDEDPGLLKFWWHSHANMGVFWSGTDDACAETLSREYAFSLVVNKKGEKRCRLDLYSPFRITFDGVKVEELIPEDKELQEECEKEVKEKVKTAYESWKGWDKDRGYGDDYGYAGGAREREYGRGSYMDSFDRRHEKTEKKRINLPESLVEDVNRLLNLANTYSTEGGIFCKETWEEYLTETLREVVEKRFEKRASCAAFGTYDKVAEYGGCHSCKVAKQCQYWTKLFQETEKDAEPYLEEVDRDMPPESIVAEATD